MLILYNSLESNRYKPVFFLYLSGAVRKRSDVYSCRSEKVFIFRNRIITYTAEHIRFSKSYTDLTWINSDNKYFSAVGQAEKL